MWPKISANSLKHNRAVWSLLLALLSVVALLLTGDKPYHESYAVSPRQVLANRDSLEGKTILVTGTVSESGLGYVDLKGVTHSTIRLNFGGSGPPRGEEVVVRTRIGAGEEAFLAEEIYTYEGTASCRVLLSTLPIPIIGFLFFWEFRFKRGKFVSRKGP